MHAAADPILPLVSVRRHILLITSSSNNLIKINPSPSKMKWYRRFKQIEHAILILKKHGLKRLLIRIRNQTNEGITNQKTQKNQEARMYQKTRTIKGAPKVSIIILSKSYKLLNNCVKSILEKTVYSNYEIVIVLNNMKRNKNVEIKNKRLRYLTSRDTFNFSSLNNLAVKHTTGSHLCFLNDDTEVISNDWIESMLEYTQKKDVGAVGCQLLYPDKSIQHAGIIINPNGVVMHINDTNSAPHEISSVHYRTAITAACLMMKKSVLLKIGMFDERFPYAYGDIDLCLRLRKQGYKIVYTPYAQLLHLETKTRGYSNVLEEDENARRMLLKKWRGTIVRH